MTHDGTHVIRFAESFCRLPSGPHAGNLVKLRPWQKDIFTDVYRLRPDGRRQYRRGLLGLPRKQGKSYLGAVLALHRLVTGGEGVEVYSTAGDREQARLVFGMARRMVELDPELRALIKLTRFELLNPANNGRYRALSSEAYSKEGLAPDLVIGDELHVQPRELVNVMTLGSGTKADALYLGITTAGQITGMDGQETVCHEWYEHGRRVSSGEVDDPSFYFRWFAPADPTADHRDPKVWAEANPAYGDFLLPEDFESAVRSTPEAEFRTKRLNLWVGSSQAWLPWGAWEALQSTRRLEDGESIVLAADGSYSGDSTALVAATLDSPHHLEVVGHWEAPPGDKHWRVDIEAVEEAIRAACLRWHVTEVAMDPFRWQRSMQALAADGVPVVEFPQSPARMGPSTTAFYQAVVAGQLTHDGHPALARHLANAVLKNDARGQRISKDAKMSARRIDLAVTGIMALSRASVPRVQKAPFEMVWLS